MGWLDGIGCFIHLRWCFYLPFIIMIYIQAGNDKFVITLALVPRKSRSIHPNRSHRNALYKVVIQIIVLSSFKYLDFSFMEMLILPLNNRRQVVLKGVDLSSLLANIQLSMTLMALAIRLTLTRFTALQKAQKL